LKKKKKKEPKEIEIDKDTSKMKEKKRITIRKFGKTRGGIVIEIPESKSLLLEVGSARLKMSAINARNINEGEIGVDLMNDGDIIYLTTTEDEEELNK